VIFCQFIGRYTMATMNKTILFDQHKALGAKMVPFGGWDMPVQYSGIVEEHLHTRSQAGLFDICHMGEFLVTGLGAAPVLDYLLTSQPSSIPEGKCRYGLMLNEAGGVIDDVITYRLKADQWMLVVNAGTRVNDWAHLSGHLAGKAQCEDQSEGLAKLDLQGPESFKVLKDVLGYDAFHLKYFAFESMGEMLVSRTGYTGELGVELYFPVGQAQKIWSALLSDARVKPVGLGARDTLRLECAMSLYGHELGEDALAAHCGVERFLPKAGGYLGFEAIAKELTLPAKQLVGLRSPNRSAPRAGEIVVCDGAEVGVVTSGSFAPSLGYGLALARIRTEVLARKEAVLEIDRGRRRSPVELCDLPFYTAGTARQKLV
jgi:aminomethyltransferase